MIDMPKSELRFGHYTATSSLKHIVNGEVPLLFNKGSVDLFEMHIYRFSQGCGLPHVQMYNLRIFSCRVIKKKKKNI